MELSRRDNGIIWNLFFVVVPWGGESMFRIAICDEDRVIRERIKQVATAYMKSKDCEAQISEMVSENEVPGKVHMVLDLQEMVTHYLDIMLTRKGSMAFPFQEGELLLSPEQIVYVESKLHRLYFHLEDGNIYTMYDVLNEWDERLQGHGFLRIHQSYLVNMDYIQEISGYAAQLVQGVRLAVPRAKYRQVRETFLNYRKGENRNESYE